MRYKIGERIHVSIERQEANFDRACDEAKRYVLEKFGANDNGHLDYVEGHKRSTDTVSVEFVKCLMHGGMGGWWHHYKFVAWVERNDDE